MRIINNFDAVRANRPHEALRDETFHHRGEQEGFHVHVEQTRDASNGVIGVQRAENKVTSHRGTNRDVRRLDIADLTNHHYIRILSQNVAETFGESQINFWFHIDLRNTGNTVLDRFFDRDDAALH